MFENKEISIKVNEIERIQIPSDNRVIKASDVFTLIDFHRGDKITVASENQKELDRNVLDSIVNMFNAIAKQLNSYEEASDSPPF